MKNIDELGISPAPWKCATDDNGEVIGIENGRGFYVARFATDVKPNDARLIAAAPKLYGKAYEVAENLLVHLAMPSQTISMNMVEVAAMAKDLLSALAKASGEVA